MQRSQSLLRGFYCVAHKFASPLAKVQDKDPRIVRICELPRYRFTSLGRKAHMERSSSLNNNYGFDNYQGAYELIEIKHLV